MSNIFEIRSRVDIQDIIKNSQDSDEVKQAEWIMFSWEEYKVHPKRVREMYEVIAKAQKLLEEINDE